MTEIRKDQELSEEQLEKIVAGKQDRNVRVGDRVSALRKRSNDAALDTPGDDGQKPRTAFGAAGDQVETFADHEPRVRPKRGMGVGRLPEDRAPTSPAFRARRSPGTRANSAHRSSVRARGPPAGGTRAAARSAARRKARAP